MHDTVGIEKVKLDNFALDITNYADKLNKDFEEASKIVEGSESYYDCESGKVFREKYHLLSENYQTIKQNILSYAKELDAVIKGYEKGTRDIATSVENITFEHRKGEI